jgi:outer membrane protein TolC
LFQALAYAAGNNPVICEAQSEVANARAGKTVAFSPFLPTIRAEDQLYKSSNPFASLMYGGSSLARDQELNIAQVNAEWIIWDFGRTLGSYRQSDIMLKVAQLRYARACQTIGYRTADAYFQVLIGKASVRVADDSIKRAEEYLRVAKNRYDAGKIDSEAVLSAQLELVNSQQLMVNAIARRQVAVAGLNNVLGVPLLKAACIQDVESRPDFFPPIEHCIQTALTKRPEMCVARNEIAYVIQQCKIAKAQFRPKATANGSFTNVTGDFEADLWEGGVQLEWDLFSGGSRAGKMREAQATMARAKAREHQIRDNIVYEVSQSYEQLRAARHQLTLSRAAIVVAGEKRRIVMDKFQVGKASPTDVVDAQTQLTTAEQDYYTAIYKLHIAIADLNYQMGNIACCPTDE